MALKKGFKAEARRRPAPDAPRRERVGPEVLEGMPWPMWHKVRTIHAMLRETKTGGEQHSVGFELTGSSAEGYVVWQSYNTNCPKNRAVESRAWEELGETYWAAGLNEKAPLRELVGRSLEMYCVVPKNGFQPLEGKAWRPWQNPEPKAYTPPPPKPPPRQAEPTGSHRYSQDDTARSTTGYTPGEWVSEVNADGVRLEYEAEPADSKTEWRPPKEPVKDTELDDEIPF